MSGIAYSNTWLGIAHSLCQALGARYRVAQGLLHAVILPHAARFNLPATVDQQERLCSAILDALDKRMPANDRVDDVSIAPEGARDSLQLPQRLRDLGIPESGLGEVAEDAFSIWHTFFNPRRVNSSDELRDVLRAAW